MIITWQDDWGIGAKLEVWREPGFEHVPPTPEEISTVIAGDPSIPVPFKRWFGGPYTRVSRFCDGCHGCKVPCGRSIDGDQ
jgi:hypothetical protein